MGRGPSLETYLCAISHLITGVNMYKGHFLPLQVPLWGWGGPKYGYLGGKNRAVLAGMLWGEDQAWKPIYVPYHILLHGLIYIRVIFDLS